MFRLFYKTLIHLFLWIILLANLFLFFDIATPLNIVGYESYPNTYYGVSSLIDMFKYLPNTPLGKASSSLQSVYQNIFNLSAKLLNDNWFVSVTGFQTVFKEGVNFGERILGFLQGIGMAIVSGFTGIASFVLGLVGVVFLILYLLFLLMSLFATLMYFLQGMFANQVPRYPSMDIQPYILSVNSVLTSLRACY